MRTQFIFSVLILCTLLACSDDEGSSLADVKADKIYIGGVMRTEAGNRPCYWHNKQYVLLPLPEGATSGTVNSIYVYGTSVYAAGYITESIGTSKPCFWKNGVYHGLSTVSADDGGEALHIDVDSSRAWISGYVEDSSSVRHAVYWEEGQNHKYLGVPYESRHSEAVSINVSGANIYCAGYVTDSSNDKIPSYWIKDDTTEERVDLVAVDSGHNGTIVAMQQRLSSPISSQIYTAGVMNDGTNSGVFYAVNRSVTFLTYPAGIDSGIITGIFFDASISTIYTSGMSPYDISNGETGCYWTGVIPTRLPGRYEDSIPQFWTTGIARHGSDIFVTGYYFRPTGKFSPFVMEPVYWINREAVDLPVVDDSTGRGGYANCIQVVD